MQVQPSLQYINELMSNSFRPDIYTNADFGQLDQNKQEEFEFQDILQPKEKDEKPDEDQGSDYLSVIENFEKMKKQEATMQGDNMSYLMESQFKYSDLQTEKPVDICVQDPLAEQDVNLHTLANIN